MTSDAARFQELGLQGKIAYLRSHGKWLTARRHGGYEIHLYQCNGFYAELWKQLALNYIHWIECSPTDRVVENYLESLNIDELFKSAR